MWHYHHFCEQANVAPYPGDPKLVGACLSLRAKDSNSVSMVDKLYSAIAHEHKKLFLTSPTEHPTIRLLMKSIRRQLARPRQPVEPLQPAHLQLINDHVLSLESPASLEVWRTAWRMNMQYFSACRFSEINCLTTADIKIQTRPTPVLILQIRQSKTDQLKEGLTKYLHGNPETANLCPVRLTQLYLTRLRCHLPLGEAYQGFLQPRVHLDPKLGYQRPLAGQKIGYISCLDETRRLLLTLGISGRFGEHSGRRGAATQAAANGGTILDIQTLGNWKSASNAQLYIDQQSKKDPKLAKLLQP